jgi:hypothetical protein
MDRVWLHLSYTPVRGKEQVCIFGLINSKFKNVHILEVYIETIFEVQTQWDHAQIPCQNAKINMFDASLSTNMLNT